MNEFIGIGGAILTALVIKAILSASKSHDDIIVLKSKVGELERQHSTGIDQLKELVKLQFKGFEDKLVHMESLIKEIKNL